MKYPEYNIESVQDTLDTYLKLHSEPMWFKCAGIEKLSAEYNAENYIRIYNQHTVSSISRKDFERTLSEIRKSRFIDDESKKIINKLLGDKKLFRKIKVCSDGSYRNNRIFCNTDIYAEKAFKINIELYRILYMQIPEEVENLTPNKKIDWLYNHFDTIFIQFWPHFKPGRISDFDKMIAEYIDFSKRLDDFEEDFFPEADRLID